MRPPNIRGDSIRLKPPVSAGRYRDAPPTLSAWAILCADASMDETGVVRIREPRRAIWLPPLPVLVDFFLVAEIPFTVSPPDDILNVQVERPIGVDARDFTIGKDFAFHESSTAIVRHVTHLQRVPILESGWHIARLWNGDRIVVESPFRVSIVATATVPRER